MYITLHSTPDFTQISSVFPPTSFFCSRIQSKTVFSHLVMMSHLDPIIVKDSIWPSWYFVLKHIFHCLYKYTDFNLNFINTEENFIEKGFSSVNSIRSHFNFSTIFPFCAVNHYHAFPHLKISFQRIFFHYKISKNIWFIILCPSWFLTMSFL